MKLSLNPGMIGVKADLGETIRLAAQYGFEAVEGNWDALAAMAPSAMEELCAELKGKGLVWGSVGAGVPIRQSREQFGEWLGRLPKLASAWQRASGKRVATWISPGDNKLTYRQNFQLHAERLREIATILGDHDLRFGLEYIGPKTSWSRQRFPFVHTLAEMKELIAEIGRPNVGLLLDSWHWYTAGETPEDILSLRNSEIVCVHLNDAPSGIAVDQQIDNRRALPASTGVINVGGFLKALNQVGYDGPVVAEPFDAELRQLPAGEALQKTIAALRKALAQLAA